MTTSKSLISLIGTALAARTALARIRQVREDGDKLEMLDAALNAAVLVTGAIVIFRRLRAGKEA